MPNQNGIHSLLVTCCQWTAQPRTRHGQKKLSVLNEEGSLSTPQSPSQIHSRTNTQVCAQQQGHLSWLPAWSHPHFPPRPFLFGQQHGRIGPRRQAGGSKPASARAWKPLRSAARLTQCDDSSPAPLQMFLKEAADWERSSRMSPCTDSSYNPCKYNNALGTW